jgi:hypothetical protein
MLRRHETERPVALCRRVVAGREGGLAAKQEACRVRERPRERLHLEAVAEQAVFLARRQPGRQLRWTTEAHDGQLSAVTAAIRQSMLERTVSPFDRAERYSCAVSSPWSPGADAAPGLTPP